MTSFSDQAIKLSANDSSPYATVIPVHRHPLANFAPPRNDFIRWLQAVLSAHNKVPLLLAGDLNAKHVSFGGPKPINNQTGTQLVCLLSEHPHILVNELGVPTRRDWSTGTRVDTVLDLAISSPQLHPSDWAPYKEEGEELYLGSDHKLLRFIVLLPIQDMAPKILYPRFSKFAWRRRKK